MDNKLLSALAFSVSIALVTACQPQSKAVSPPQTASEPQGSGSPATSATYLHRKIQDEVFYFVMPDRFHNGNTDNDMGAADIPLSYGGYDPTDKNKYHGGDMAGLLEKLDYLQGMGVTAIWMTPIMRNQALQGDIAGYHGYWVLDFTEIDPHLGSNGDLKRLIEEAHKRDMKVFFDIITNHTADVIKYVECHGEDGAGWSGEGNLCPYKSLQQVASGDTYTTVIPKGLENAKVPAWLNDPTYYHNQGDSTWEGENAVYGDFIGLDDVDTDNPEVVAGMIDIFKDIVTEFKPDGFRIDTVKHVNIEFWQRFTPAIERHAAELGIPNFFMFGEVYDSRAEVLSRFTTEGALPSVLDFGFQSMVYQTLIEDQGTDNIRTFFAQDFWYNDGDSRADELLNFVGNHDMGRFGYFLKREKSHLSASEKLDRTLLAHGLMYFTRGVPVIYYGDEQGFVGDGSNQDARADMMPSRVVDYNDDDLLGSDATTADDNFDPDHPLYVGLRDFAKVYQQHPALRTGVQKERYSQPEPGLYVISRMDRTTNTEYLVAFNTGATPASASIRDHSGGYEAVYGATIPRLTPTKGQVSVALPGHSLAVYKGLQPPMVQEVLDLAITNLNSGSRVSDRQEIRFHSNALTAAPLSPFELSVWVKQGDDEFALMAFDENLPLSALVDFSAYPSGASIVVQTRLTLGQQPRIVEEITVIKQ